MEKMLPALPFWHCQDAAVLAIWLQSTGASMQTAAIETELQAHAAADLFPMMGGSDLAALIADIRAHGQREPIIVHDGLILDGRNRFRACQQIGVEPVTAEWDRVGTPEAFVVSMNLHRRHLNESQRGMIAAKLATRTREETLRPGGRNLDDGIQPSSLTTKQTADLLNIGRDTVSSAKTVLAKGTPDEIAAVERGEAAVHTVARQIRKGQAPQKHKSTRDAPLNQTGQNPERIQRMQMQAEIWARLSDGLIGLTSLPLPADVVEIVAANQQRSRVVDDRLSRSLQWLKDFEHVWRNRG